MNTFLKMEWYRGCHYHMSCYTIQATDDPQAIRQIVYLMDDVVWC